MNYLGKGKLIGFKSYTKDNKEKFVYTVLNGNMNKSGLYDNIEVITIVQDEQTIKDLKPQEVTFEVSAITFSGQTRNKYLNIKAI